MITVSEAHKRWGDLAKIERGVTRWMSVETDQGTWYPVFDDTGILLLGYELNFSVLFRGDAGSYRKFVAS